MLRIALKSVVPAEIFLLNRPSALSEVESVLTDYDDRLRIVVGDLIAIGAAGAEDMLIAEHRMSLFGHVSAVKEIDKELKTVYWEASEEESIRRRRIKYRLQAIGRWCELVGGLKNVSVRMAWKKRLYVRRNLSEGAFGLPAPTSSPERKADFWRTMVHRREKQVKIKIDDILEILWACGRDLNSLEDPPGAALLQETVWCMSYLRHLVTHENSGSGVVFRGSTADKIDSMLRQILQSGFDLDLKLITQSSAWRLGGKGEPLELGKDGVLALANHYGREGKVWKMIAAVETFGRVGSTSPFTPVSESSVADRGDRWSNSVETPFFDSASGQAPTVPEAGTLPSAQPEPGLFSLDRSILRDLWPSKTSHPSHDSVEVDHSETDSSPGGAPSINETQLPNSPISTPVSPKWKPKQKSRTTSSPSSTPKRSPILPRTYNDFITTPLMPMAAAVQILPSTSNLSPNIHSYPISTRDLKGPNDESTTLLWSSMVSHAVGHEDLSAVMHILRAYLGNAAEHQIAFVRRVLTAWEDQRDPAEADGSKPQRDRRKDPQDDRLLQAQLEPWKDIKPPATELASLPFQRGQAFARKLYHTLVRRPNRQLTELQSMMREVQQRLYEEHVLLSGYEPAGESISMTEYPRVMRKCEVIRPDAPFTGVIKATSGDTAAFRPPTWSFHTLESSLPFDPRSYLARIHANHTAMTRMLGYSRTEATRHRSVMNRKQAKYRMRRREEWRAGSDVRRTGGPGPDDDGSASGMTESPEHD